MENLLSVWENVLSMAKVTKCGQYCIKEKESAIISKIVINFYIVIWFGESCYIIYFSSILLLFVNLISYYQALTFTHMIYVEITLSNEYMFICFAPSMFVFLNCFATGWCKVSLIALVLSWLHWLFSSVRFQMNLQIVGLSRCKVTSVAFVWLYRASVRFQMSLQTEWSRCSKVTLAAFVWLFDTVCFQMSPQIACLNGCKVTLVAFVWLFSTVRF